MNPELEILADIPLQAHLSRIALARRSLDYYELKGIHHMKPRKYETNDSYSAKPKISLPLAKSAIDALTKNLYNPGPKRSHSDPAINSYLDFVYSSNNFDMLCSRADAWGLLHGAVGVGVSATPGKGAGSCRIDLYGGHELAVWCPADDPGRPYAVCVISGTAEAKVFTLWTAETCTVYEKRGNDPTKRIEKFENPYKVIPFEFYHVAGVIVREFWEGGIGNYLSDLNAELDNQFSDIGMGLSNSVPILWGINCDSAQQIVASPGWLNHLKPGNSLGAGPPQLGYTSSPYDSREALNAAIGIYQSALELLGVPKTALGAGQVTAQSGIALLLEQLPLLSEAEKRKRYTNLFEKSFASMILTAMGNFYGVPAWVGAAGAPISLNWPGFKLPVPLPEQDDQDQQLLDWGLQSLVGLAQSRFGISREQAIELLRRNEEDKKILEGFKEQQNFGFQQPPQPQPTPTPGPQPSEPQPTPTKEAL